LIGLFLGSEWRVGVFSGALFFVFTISSKCLQSAFTTVAIIKVDTESEIISI